MRVICLLSGLIRAPARRSFSIGGNSGMVNFEIKPRETKPPNSPRVCFSILVYNK